MSNPDEFIEITADLDAPSSDRVVYTYSAEETAAFHAFEVLMVAYRRFLAAEAAAWASRQGPFHEFGTSRFEPEGSHPSWPWANKETK